jgi:hypothetical protein
LPRGARRSGGGGAPRSRHLAPALQRRGRFHRTRPILRRGGEPQGVALDGAGRSTFDDPDTRDSCRLDPYRRYPSKPSRVPATNAGRGAALRRRSRPGPETGRRKENASGRSRGGRPRSPLGRPDLRGDSSRGLHLPWASPTSSVWRTRGRTG